MDTLGVAISLLDLEIQKLGDPKVGTAAWWTLRGKSTGLSLLKTLQQRGITDPVAADEFRKDLRTSLVAP